MITDTDADASLLLYCTDHQWQPENLEKTISLLQTMALIEEPVSNLVNTPENAFFTGNKFLSHIAFMGCSPSIEFTPGKACSRFCYVHFISAANPLLLYSKKQARAPRCPVCHKHEKLWQKSFSDNRIYCTHCQQNYAVETFNWSKSAGVASFFIAITDIFPHEAIPQPVFLESLKTLHSAEWKYFYYYK